MDVFRGGQIRKIKPVIPSVNTEMMDELRREIRDALLI